MNALPTCFPTAARMFCLTICAGVGSLQAATIAVPAGATQAQIQTAINGATAGDVVRFSSGAVHALTSTLTLKSGVTIDGNSARWSYSHASAILVGVNAGALTDVTIRNLELDNVMFRFWSTTDVSAVDAITVDNCTFLNGRAQSGSTQVNSFYIQVRATNVVIKNSRFLRTAPHKGKGVQFYLAENCAVRDCLFGVGSAAASDFTTHGHFKTAINVANSSTGGSVVEANSAKDITITGNLVYRNPAMADTGGDAGDSDHGIYAHGFDGLTVSANTISGWAPDAAGGAIKIRNAQNAVIEANTFLRSGVMLYVYSGHPFLFLRRVAVRANTITLTTLPASPNIYSGVGFWRNYATTAQAEQSILVVGNTIQNGHIYLWQNASDPVHAADWCSSGGGVFANTLAGGGQIHLQAGMSPGNSPAPVWH